MKIPRQLGRYRILNEMPCGVTSILLEAHESEQNRRFVLKLPRVSVGTNNSVATSFVQGARSAAVLRHPGICPLFETGSVDGTPFVSMQSVGGSSLADLFIAREQYDAEQSSRLIHYLAKTLAACHDQGLVHGGLHPGNVMLTSAGLPVVLDLGLCDPGSRHKILLAVAKDTAPTALTFLAPEQINPDSQTGPKTDIYSLGAILYRLLTGRLLFEGSVDSVVESIRGNRQITLSATGKFVPQTLEELCLHMLAHEPQQRPSSMDEVRQTLEGMSSERSVEEHDGNTKTPDASTDRLADNHLHHRIRELLRAGEDAEAEQLLLRVCRDSDNRNTRLSRWARQKLADLRKSRQRIQAGRREVYQTAIRLMRSHDYDQAAQLMKEYSPHERTRNMQELLDRAEENATEVRRLRAAAQQAYRDDDQDKTRLLLDQLLALTPGDKAARQLQHKLNVSSGGTTWMLITLTALVCIAVAAGGYAWSLRSSQVPTSRSPPLAESDSRLTTPPAPAPIAPAPAASTPAPDTIPSAPATISPAPAISTPAPEPQQTAPAEAVPETPDEQGPITEDEVATVLARLRAVGFEARARHNPGTSRFSMHDPDTTVAIECTYQGNPGPRQISAMKSRILTTASFDQIDEPSLSQLVTLPNLFRINAPIGVGDQNPESAAREIGLLHQSPSLQQLILTEPISAELLTHLGDMLKVKRLNAQLTGNSGQLKHLAGLRNLEALSLENTPLNDDDLRVLEGLNRLRRLSIDVAGTTAEGLQHVFAISTLTSVRLSNCSQIHNPAFEDITQLSQLNSLALDVHSGLSEATWKRVGELSGLTSLSIYEGTIPASAMEHLAQLQNLEVLILDRCRFTRSAASHIARLKNLTFLALSESKIASKALRPLAELEKLEHLDISLSSGITASELERFLSFAPIQHLSIVDGDFTNAEQRRIERFVGLLVKPSK